MKYYKERRPMVWLLYIRFCRYLPFPLWWIYDKDEIIKTGKFYPITDVIDKLNVVHKYGIIQYSYITYNTKINIVCDMDLKMMKEAFE